MAEVGWAEAASVEATVVATAAAATAVGVMPKTPLRERLRGAETRTFSKPFRSLLLEYQDNSEKCLNL